MSAAVLSRAESSATALVEGDGLFSGYASLFGVVDLSGDMVLPGAFRASLARRGAEGIRMLYQHDPAVPLGRWLKIEEDGKGLRVTGQLQTEVAKAADVWRLLSAGVIDGLSIGFRTVRARSDAKSGVRRVMEVDLWEISIVTFPMLTGARVTKVGLDAKSAALADRLRRMERRLRV